MRSSISKTISFFLPSFTPSTTTRITTRSGSFGNVSLGSATAAKRERGAIDAPSRSTGVAWIAHGLVVERRELPLVGPGHGRRAAERDERFALPDRFGELELLDFGQ